jgi:hypothetical protein
LSQRPLPDNTQHSQKTSIPPVRFEPTISAGERPQPTPCTARPLGPAPIGEGTSSFPTSIAMITCYCAKQLSDSTVALVRPLPVPYSCNDRLLSCPKYSASLLLLSQMNPLPSLLFCFSVLPTIYACVFPSGAFPSVIPVHSTCQAHLDCRSRRSS